MEKMSSSRDINEDPFNQGDRNIERVIKRRQGKPRITGQQKKMTRKPQRRIQPPTSAEKQLQMQLPLQAQPRQVVDNCQEGNRPQQTHQLQQPEGQQYGALVTGDVVASTNAPDRFFLRFEGITAVVHQEMLPLMDHFMTIVLELKAEVDTVKRSRDTAYAENRILQGQLLMCHREHTQRYTESQQSQTEQHTQEQQTQTEGHTKDKQTQTQQYSQKPKQYERHTPLQHPRRRIHTEEHRAEQERDTPTQQPQQRPSELGRPEQTRHKKQIQSHQSQPARQSTPQGRPENSQQQQRNSPQRDKQKYYNRRRQRQRWKHKKHDNDTDKKILTAIREVGQMVAMSPAASQVPGPPEVSASSSVAQSLNPASGLIPMSWSIGAQQQFASSALLPMPNLSISNGLQMSPYWRAPYF